jgi:hypothetical protein
VKPICLPVLLLLFVLPPSKAAMLMCPVAERGAIVRAQGTFFRQSPPRFGRQKDEADGVTWRGYIWWDTSRLPAEAIIDEASLAFGFARIEWGKGTCDVRVVPIRTDFSGWTAADDDRRFALVGAPTRLWLDESFSEPVWSFGRSMRVPAGESVLLRSARFGLGFSLTENGGQDESPSTVILEATAIDGLKVIYHLPPRPLQPRDGARVRTMREIVFSWEDSLPAGTRLRYRVQLSPMPVFSENLMQSDWIAGGAWRTHAPPRAAEVYWRVRLEDPEDPENVSAWSRTMFFTCDVSQEPARESSTAMALHENHE